MSPTRRKRRAPSRAVRAPRRAVPLFAALGDDVRLGLVRRLSARGPLSTMRLAEGTRMTRQAVSKHLDVLADAGIVRSARRGRERIWEVDATPLRAAQQWLDAIARDWDDVLERLRDVVEG
jgi:DNA-binding transcriptional ArsR family regulator